jgi:hypothetical protein
MLIGKFIFTASPSEDPPVPPTITPMLFEDMSKQIPSITRIPLAPPPAPSPNSKAVPPSPPVISSMLLLEMDERKTESAVIPSALPPSPPGVILAFPPVRPTICEIYETISTRKRKKERKKITVLEVVSELDRLICIPNALPPTPPIKGVPENITPPPCIELMIFP